MNAVSEGNTGTPGQAERSALYDLLRQAAGEIKRCRSVTVTCASCDGQIAAVMDATDAYAAATGDALAKEILKNADPDDFEVDNAPTAIEYVRRLEAAYDALAAQERPAPGDVEAAFASGMRVRTGPCTADGHDRDHFQVRTNAHWVCGHLLASLLIAQGVVAHPQERSAPEPDGGNAYEPVVCECGHPQTDHAFSAEVCAWLRCKCDSYRPQPAPDAARAAETRQLAAAMADTAHVRDAAAHVLSWFREHRNPVRMEASVTRAQLANAYRDGGLPVPEELRRFL